MTPIPNQNNQGRRDVTTGKFLVRPLQWWGGILSPGWNRVVSESLGMTAVARSPLQLRLCVLLTNNIFPFFRDSPFLRDSPCVSIQDLRENLFRDKFENFKTQTQSGSSKSMMGSSDSVRQVSQWLVCIVKND